MTVEQQSLAAHIVGAACLVIFVLAGRYLVDLFRGQ